MTFTVMNTTKHSANHSIIQEQAIDWLVRLRDDQVDGETIEAFSAWLAQDPSHIQAFSAAEMLFKDMQKAAQSNTSSPFQPAISENLTRFKPPRQTAKRMHPLLRTGFGMAAVWLIAINLIIPSQAKLLQSYFSDYHTQTGEFLEIQLSDSSRVLLNTNSAISVNFTAKVRQIQLHHGQARFTVAKDQQRPFEVLSGNLRTQALGTVFELNHRINTETSVVVQEHAVSASLTEDDKPSGKIKIKEGQILHYRSGQILPQPEPVILSQVTAWQQHRLIINDRPLIELIDELERYQTGRIFIRDNSLKNLRVTGVFSLDNPQNTLRIVCEALNLQHTKIGPWWIVLHR